MANEDLKNALLKVHGIQPLRGGGAATHTMPDGTVMPGATHAEYQAMGYQDGGDVDAQAVQNMAMAQEQMANQNVDLETAISGLMAQRETAEDPDEIAAADQLLAKTEMTAQAPMAEMSAEIAAQGRGGDTLLAHLTQGETILPMAMMDDPKFERAVENRFKELDLDPEEYVAGVGIASLNPMTGLEEFGFFKKLFKGIKKIAKKIAPIAGPLANFIPGVGPILAGAIGAATNVVAGKGLKGAISGGLGGWGAGKLMGGIGSLGTVGGNVVGKFNPVTGTGGFQNLGFFDKFRALGSGAKAGIGSLFGGAPVTQGTGGQYQIQPGDNLNQIAQANGMTVDQLLGANPQITDPNMIYAGQGLNIPGVSTNNQPGGFQLSNLWRGGGSDNVGNYGMLGDVAGGFTDRLGLTNYGTGQGQGQGQGGGFGGRLGGGLGSLAMAGVPAYMLGKMAYDEAKADKGVPLTPLTTMGPTGRYNIEAEIARRMGTQTPNPVEFGLLPHGTFPELSGGRPMAAAGGGAVYPMAYANGGDVAMEDFERMNGGINGPGTETSDDVPAMLSDGEFVFTGEAVRGAGAFDMNNQGGILTLTPSGTPDRERGTNVMYEMMDLLGAMPMPMPRKFQYGGIAGLGGGYDPYGGYGGGYGDPYGGYGDPYGGYGDPYGGGYDPYGGYGGYDPGPARAQPALPPPAAQPALPPPAAQPALPPPAAQPALPPPTEAAGQNRPYMRQALKPAPTSCRILTTRTIVVWPRWQRRFYTRRHASSRNHVFQS
jgi:hypothetical protein